MRLHFRNLFLFVLLIPIIGIIIAITIFAYSKIYQKIQPPKYNLILISIDTLRPDHMGVYGYEKNTTPNIDKWAKGALVFDNVYTTIPNTYPSFVSIMTGQEPISKQAINIASLPLDRDEKTLAWYLKKNGYTTSAFVTNSYLFPDFSNLNIGFDNYQYLDYIKVKRTEYESFIDKAIADLNDFKLPFFLWIHLMDPHSPYAAMDKFKCKFNDKYCQEISNNSVEYNEFQRKKYQGFQVPPLDVKTVDYYETLYDGSIASSDLIVKKIFDELKKKKLNDNSIIVIYGDHGEGFDHNYYFLHGDVLYNSSVKIPLIIRYPYQIEYKLKNNDLIQNTDIFPTILDLLDISYNSEDIDGKSFSSLLSDNKSVIQNKRQYVYSMNIDLSKYLISDGKYNYLFSFDITRKKHLYNNQNEELYDVNIDKTQQNNLLYTKSDEKELLKRNLFLFLSKYHLPLESEKNSTKDLYNNLERLKKLTY